MGDLEIEFMKYKNNEWDTLDIDNQKFVYGRLKALEELALYIDTMRESLTKLLVVNGCQDCETEDDLKERWSGVKGLDNSISSNSDNESSKSI